ncbi:PAS domain S-box protein [Halorhodospira halochloris]|uniref:PAS domain S-box protein n=1 Tax=Halorhodospira halochloris TaxID=1052 RepID=UPI001EE91036|nr:PAS domain S-box protein [Halorhodospira halochloris]MCG5547926.1 PAS domain S-box protein [Halorhodospira halochloris]
MAHSDSYGGLCGTACLSSQVIDSLPEGVFCVDVQGNFTYLNPAACNLLGYERPDDLLGKYSHDLIHGRACHTNFTSGPKTCPTLHALRTGEASQAEEDCFLRRDGGILEVTIHAAALFDEHRRISGAVVSFHGISERKRLERERDDLVEVIENSRDYIGLADEQCRIVYENPSLKQLRQRVQQQRGDYSDEHHECATLHTEPLRRKLYDEVLPIVIEQGLWHGESELISGVEGRPLPVSQTIVAHYDHAGNVRRFSTIIRDLSYRKAIEAQLRQRESQLAEQEALYRELVENHPHLIGRYRPDTTVLFVNQAQADFFGCAPEQMIGRRWMAMIPAQEREVARCYLARFTPQEPVHSVELAQQRADGEMRWIHWTNKAYFDENAELIYFQAVGIDTTERRQAEQALRDSEKRFREMAENIDEIFWVRTADKMLYLNPAFERQTGLTRESAYANPDGFIDHIHPDDREAIAAKVNDSAGGGAYFDEVFRFIRPDTNEQCWLHARCMPIYNEQGEVARSVGTARDVSPFMALQQQLQQALKSKTFYLHAISHDMRTPLSAMLGVMESLLATPLTPWQVHQLQLCRSAAMQSLGLLDTLLLMARSEAGYVELNYESLSLHYFLDEQMQLFGVQAKEKDLELSHHIDAGVPERVEVDRLRLGQVLANLVINAIKFTDQGSVQVEVTQSEPQVLRFAVRDTGAGIAPERQQAILDAFEQEKPGDLAASAGKRGFGLGLSISCELLKQMGGSLWLNSLPGEGSTFYFKVPFTYSSGYTAYHGEEADSVANVSRQKANDPVFSNAGSAQIVANEYSVVCPGAGLNVLVVEDEPVSAMLFRTLLEQLGAEVTGAFNGEQALSIWQNAEFDIVFTDLALPRLSGKELVVAVREHEQANCLTRTPIIILSGYAPEDRPNAEESLDIDDYLHKPLEIKELVELLRRFN